MDYEGKWRLDHVSKDLVLELKVDKLALKFIKHEENGMSSSSEG